MVRRFAYSALSFRFPAQARAGIFLPAGGAAAFGGPGGPRPPRASQTQQQAPEACLRLPLFSALCAPAAPLGTQRNRTCRDKRGEGRASPARGA